MRITESLSGTAIRIGKVVFVHPQANAIDVMFIDDGSRMVGVQVMRPRAGTRSGVMGLDEPAEPDDDPWRPVLTGDQDVLAVIALTSAMPVCLGFLPPQVGQMTFQEKGLYIDRYPSDTYQLIDRQGDYEIVHPGGSHLLISAKEKPKELDRNDFDERWAIGRNTASAPTITLRTPRADWLVTHDGFIRGDAREKIETHSDDNTEIDTDTDLKTHSDGDTEIDANVDIRVHADGRVEIGANADVTITAAGDVVIQGGHIKLN